MEEKYTLEFNVVEVDFILKALMKMPYEHSASLIHRVRKDLTEQQMEREKAVKNKK